MLTRIRSVNEYIKVSMQVDAGELFMDSGTGFQEFLFSLCILGGNCNTPGQLTKILQETLQHKRAA
jgi:hypothetical protein